MVTEIREPNYSADLPGEWDRAESLEPGTFVYRDRNSRDTLSVTLLAVKPTYAIADAQMLLEQYMHHRAQFERGGGVALQQSEAVSWTRDERTEGAWSGHDSETGRRILHRVLLTEGMLADFRYVAFDMDADGFLLRAGTALDSVAATAS